MRALLLLSTTLALTACTPALQERWEHSLYKDRQRLAAFDFQRDAVRLMDLKEVYPSYTLAEQRAEAETCFHPTAQQRYVMQNGVSDKVNYTWCALAPYGDNEGQRLDGRPVVAN